MKCNSQSVTSVSCNCRDKKKSTPSFLILSLIISFFLLVFFFLVCFWFKKKKDNVLLLQPVDQLTHVNAKILSEETRHHIDYATGSAVIH